MSVYEYKNHSYQDTFSIFYNESYVKHLSAMYVRIAG